MPTTTVAVPLSASLRSDPSIADNSMFWGKRPQQQAARIYRSGKNRTSRPRRSRLAIACSLPSENEGRRGQSCVDFRNGFPCGLSGRKPAAGCPPENRPFSWRGHLEMESVSAPEPGETVGRHRDVQCRISHESAAVTLAANAIERLNNVRPSHGMWFENHRM
jgi:hypothetical protein